MRYVAGALAESGALVAYCTKLLEDHELYIREHFDDLPEIKDWGVVIEVEQSSAVHRRQLNLLQEPTVTAEPAIEAEHGIRFDFNEGIRVTVPSRPCGSWRVRLSDLDTGNTLFDTRLAGGMIASAKKWFFRGRIEVFDGDISILDHGYDADSQEILIRFHIGTLGDILAWFPYAAEFAQRHHCKLTCCLSEQLIPLFRRRVSTDPFHHAADG